ncbi:MAG TPA: hypothetical protein VF178_00360 [Gemmatimonadaceae bacterium]
MSNAPNLELFNELVPQAPLADLLVPAPPREGASEGVDRRLLRRIRIRPEALDHFLLQMTPIATEFGLTEAERANVAIFVRKNDLLLMMDLGHGRTPTVDGRERPLNLRARIPVEAVEEEVSSARQVGAWVRFRDLVTALRNRVENSENFGITLTSATLDFMADESGSYPSMLVVRPDGVVRPREVPTLGGVDLKAFRMPEPLRAAGGIPDLDPEALIELGAYAPEATGVCLRLGDDENPTLLSTIGPRGVLICKVKSGGVKDVGGPSERTLMGDVVLSPEFALAAGFSQQVLETLFYRRHGVRMNRYAGDTVSAAIAASLDVARKQDGTNPVLDALHVELGKRLIERALGTRGGRELEQAIAASRTLLQAVEESEQATFADHVERLAGDEVSEGERGTLRHLAAGDPVLERVAMGVLVAGRRPELRSTLAGMLGEARLRAAAREAITEARSVKAVERLRHTDLAIGAVRLRGTYSDGLTDLLLPLVPAEKAAEWWQRFEAYLAQRKVPEEIRANVLRARSQTRLPSTAELDFESKSRTDWATRAKRPAQGRFWSDADGRVYYGAGDDEFGEIMISDLAIQPDPAAFPVSRSEVEKLVGEKAIEWRSTLWASDVDWAARRAAGTLDANVIAGSPTDERTEARGLFLVRWVPAGHDEAPEGEVLNHIRSPRRRPETPETIYIGEGDSEREYHVARNPNTPKGDPERVGSLRVFPLSIWGQEQYLDLPLKDVPTGKTKEPVAFVLDAEDLNLLLSFVTRKGRQVYLEVAPGAVRVADKAYSRTVLLPKVNRTRVPAMFRAHVAAAGVPDAGEPLSLEMLIARAGHARRAREAQVAALPPSISTPPEPTVQGGIEWKPAPSPSRKRGRADRRSRAEVRLQAQMEGDLAALLDGGWLSREAALLTLNRKIEQVARRIEIAEQQLEQRRRGHETLFGLEPVVADAPAEGEVERKKRKDPIEKRLNALQLEWRSWVNLRAKYFALGTDGPEVAPYREGVERYDPVLRAAEVEVAADLGEGVTGGKRLFEHDGTSPRLARSSPQRR